MTKNNGIRVSLNNSKAQSTPNSAKTVSITKFTIEKNAKNQAYSFILQSGLLDQFNDFCRVSKSINPHGDCLDFLNSKI